MCSACAWYTCTCTCTCACVCMLCMLCMLYMCMHVHVHVHVVQCMRSACAVHVQSSQCVTTEPTTLCAGHDRGGALCGAGQQAAAVPVGPGAARHEILRPQARQTNVHPEVPGCHLSSQYKVKVINNTFILRSRGRLTGHTAHARSSTALSTISNGIKLYDVVEIRGQSIFYKVKI